MVPPISIDRPEQSSFKYAIQPTDLWALNIMFILRQPLLRLTLATLLFSILLGAGVFFYLFTDASLVESTALAVACGVVGLLLFWWLGKAVVVRVGSLAHNPPLQELRVSESAFEVRDETSSHTYSWTAITRLVVTRRYTYVFIGGASGYAFRRTGFSSADNGSEFFRILRSFVGSERIVISDRVAGDDRKE